MEFPNNRRKSSPSVVPPDQSRSPAIRFTSYYPLIPIPVGCLVIAILSALYASSTAVFEARGLVLVLNVCFLGMLPCFLVYVAVTSYLSTGSPGLVLLAAGCLSLGVGNVAAAFVLVFKPEPNDAVFIHNASVLASAIFHLLAAAVALQGVPSQEDPLSRKAVVVFVAIGVLAFEVFLLLMSFAGAAPTFFIQGTGPTTLRQTILGGAIVLFLVAGFLLSMAYVRSRSRFILWYSGALFLIAEGLISIAMQKAVGSPMGWVGRSFQYLGAVYLLVAIVQARNELAIQGQTLKEGLALLLRHYLANSEQMLRRVNEEWELTFDSIPDPIMILDSHHGIVRANKAMLQVVGETRETVVGKKCYELVHRTDRPPSFCPHSRLLETGQEQTEEVFEPALGGTYDVRVYPTRDSGGTVVGAVHIARDITERKRLEEELRTSESLLKVVVGTAPAGIGLVENRVFRWCNEYLTRITGYSVEELLGQNARILYETDEEYEYVGKVKYDQIRATGTGSVETRWRRKDGSIVDVFLCSSAVNPHDLSVGVVFTATDISALKKVIADLHQAHAETEALLNGTQALLECPRFQDASGTLVPIGKTAIGANIGYLALLEDDGSEKIIFEEAGKSACLFDSFSLIPVQKLRAEVLRTRQAAYVNEVGTGETKSRGPQEFPILENLLLAPLILENNVVGILGMGNKPGGFQDGDVQLVEAFADLAVLGLLNSRNLEALQESETRTRLLVDAAPIGILVAQNYRCKYVNPAFLQMFEYETPEKVEDLPVEELFAPESKELVRARKAARAAGQPLPAHYEAVAMTNHGRPFPVEVWTSQIMFGGKQSVLAFISDVSESKKLRAQLLHAQKMEAIGTLAGGIAHDFNNILQVILGFSEIMLLTKTETEADYQDLQKILDAGKRGADLVRKLLTFSRKTESHPKSLNLNQHIQQVAALLKRTIPKTIQIQLVLDDQLLPIYADPTLIEQILINLALNARDAMPDEGILTIETTNVMLDEEYCRMHLGSNPGRHVLLSVSDTGIGMDKETLGHIFEPFFSTKPAGKGTGLGLAIVYGIVKQHNGSIQCYSEPGIGTTFKLYFPAIEQHDDVTLRYEEQKLPRGTETILVVDDEEVVRELATRILSRAGYTVITAANGREALKRYEEHDQVIALIILDLIMPEMDGKRCLSELLKMNPKVKVIVASGFAENGLTKEAIHTGARGFVSKPFHIPQLLQTIRNVLDEP